MKYTLNTVNCVKKIKAFSTYRRLKMWNILKVFLTCRLYCKNVYWVVGRILRFDIDILERWQVRQTFLVRKRCSGHVCCQAVTWDLNINKVSNSFYTFATITRIRHTRHRLGLDSCSLLHYCATDRTQWPSWSES